MDRLMWFLFQGERGGVGETDRQTDRQTETEKLVYMQTKETGTHKKETKYFKPSRFWQAQHFQSPTFFFIFFSTNVIASRCVRPLTENANLLDCHKSSAYVFPRAYACFFIGSKIGEQKIATAAFELTVSATWPACQWCEDSLSSSIFPCQRRAKRLPYKFLFWPIECRCVGRSREVHRRTRFKLDE